MAAPRERAALGKPRSRQRAGSKPKTVWDPSRLQVEQENGESVIPEVSRKRNVLVHAGIHEHGGSCLAAEVDSGNGANFLKHRRELPRFHPPEH